MVEAARRLQNTLHHMLARRTLTAIILPMELDTAAIVPKDFGETHTCKRPVDAKVMNTSLLIYLGFLVISFFLKLTVGKNKPYLIPVWFHVTVGKISMSALLKGHARITASTRRAVSTVRAHQG
jgi:hypothetical protein